MKKLILLLSYVVIHACPAFFENPCFSQVIEWQKSLGGTLDEEARDILQTIDGGYIVAGLTASNDGDVTANHGGNDYWIVKLDTAGNIQWQKSLGGSGEDRAYNVQQTIDSCFIVIGYSNSADGDVTNNYGDYDIWIVKLNNLGNILWQKSFGGTNLDIGQSILQTLDGGYIMVSGTESNDNDVTGNHGDRDYWVVKLDGAGNIQWQECLGGTNTEQPYEIQKTINGGYIITGFAESNDGDVSGNHGVYDYWIVKIDSLGQIQWQKCYGGLDDEWGYSIHQTFDGGYIISGFTESDDLNGYNGGVNDSWTIKLDGGGNLQWQTCLGGTSTERSYSNLQTPDGGYIIENFSNSNDGNVSGNHGDLDYWLVKLDWSGAIQWQQCYGGTAGDLQNKIKQTSDGGLVMAGYASSNDGDVTGNHGGNDFWIVKLTDDFNSITGKLFIDVNSNATYDTNEVVVNNKKVTEINSSRFAFSDQDGEYRLYVLDSGNFTVTPSFGINYYNAVPVNQAVYFSGIHQVDSLNDFAFQPAGVFNDLCITITPMTPFRPGFNALYMINYENVGTTTLSPTIIFFNDIVETYLYSSPNANTISFDSIVWNLGSLAPYQTGFITLWVHVSPGAIIGTLINSSVRIEPILGDANSSCNYAFSQFSTTGGYDPNTILVDKDTVLTTELSNPPYLDYIIYFQNTGNDTAFTVKLMNEIPVELDLNTIEFVASSHPLSISHLYLSRFMEFKFENILLPDSNINEPASHGFVRYRIKPVSTLVAGDSIKNNAAIYFDFNAPVQTNTAVTEIVLPTGEEEFKVQSLKFKVYPNPTNDIITISALQLIADNCQLKIYDLYGREVFQLQTSNFQLQTKVNVSGFSAGIYFLELQSGEKVLRGKFLKE